MRPESAQRTRTWIELAVGLVGTPLPSVPSGKAAGAGAGSSYGKLLSDLATPFHSATGGASPATIQRTLRRRRTRGSAGPVTFGSDSIAGWADFQPEA